MLLPAVLALTTQPFASADAQGTVYLPPFMPDFAISGTSFPPDCPGTLSPPLSTNPSIGRLDTRVGISVVGCASERWVSRRESWVLGPVPAPLVGRAALVSAVVVLDSVQLAHSGSADLRAAVELIFETGAPFTLYAAQCSGACEVDDADLAGAGVVVVQVIVPSLDATLDMAIDSAARGAAGTGSIDLKVRGLVRAVTLVPM